MDIEVVLARAAARSERVATRNVQRRPGYYRQYAMTVPGRAALLCGAAKARAAKKGLPFDLTQDWVADRVGRGVCEATGMAFVLKSDTGPGHNLNAHSPSIDRIDHAKGYTQDNCRVVVWIFNRARGAFSDAELIEMARAIAERHSPCEKL